MQNDLLQAACLVTGVVGIIADAGDNEIKLADRKTQPAVFHMEGHHDD